MLTYLDVLVAAIQRSDAEAIARLLTHPMARTLTREALSEGRAAVAGTLDGAPLHLLQLRHQTAQLLGEASVERRALRGNGTRSVSTEGARAEGMPQIELPLSV